LKQTIETLEEYGKYSNNLIQKNKVKKDLKKVEDKLNKNKYNCDECKCEFNK